MKPQMSDPVSSKVQQHFLDQYILAESAFKLVDWKQSKKRDVPCAGLLTKRHTVYNRALQTTARKAISPGPQMHSINN